ncbi:MAG: response regulator [Thermodesulfobacteriota bacterium]
MITEEKQVVVQEHGKGLRTLLTALGLGIVLPLGGTLVIPGLMPDWSWISLPLHSTLEVTGAVLGLVLAVLILFSQQKAHTSRKMWIACALVSMAVLDIYHSCVPAGQRFVWLHSLAVLAGGVFFALVWFPERGISRGTALATTGAVLLVTLILGLSSSLYSGSVPVMIVENQFTPLAYALNLIGGGLTLLAALNFAVTWFGNRSREDFFFLLMCLLFGGAGVLFRFSNAWEADWWFWHVLRLGAYLLTFWLAMLSFWGSEREMIRTHGELDGLFHTAVDGKRLIDRDFNQLRTNETFARLSGMNPEAMRKMKCYEAFRGPLCHTDECPMKQFETGATDRIQREIVETRRDGREVACILNVLRLNAEDGSFRGIIESFWDITDRKEAEDKLARQAAQKTSQADLASLMRGDLETDELCRNIITFLCKYLHAQTGLMYLADEQGTLRLAASYAHKRRKHLAAEYKPGEGLVGQAALEREDIILANVPEDYIAIESGLGEAVPRHIYVKPIIHNGRVRSVLELGTLHGFDEPHSVFLNMVAESIALAVESAQAKATQSRLLEESQRLTEELQVQQEELRTTNEELEAQTRRLLESEERLKVQQEELQVTNEELEEKNDLLERQKKEVERARKEIEEKAGDLALASKYKSEFLANMSHELRTPLNSLLLLAQGLAQNKEGNLTADQIKSTQIIYGSGSDLLNLINEILDLSKIEAGRMDIRPGEVRISDLADGVQASFQHLAEEKGINLDVIVSEDAPSEIVSDRKRIEQIIRNLTSNAVKFTEQGKVTVIFGRPASKTDLSRSGLASGDCLAVAVKDTGIGIAPEQQKIVFEAFQQADGGSARKYGGTGLGLSISRELARLLGGELQLESDLGKGSTFTLYLPLTAPAGGKISSGRGVPAGRYESDAPRLVARQEAVVRIMDDRNHLEPGERVILVIEDDPNFARLLYDKSHEKGFKCLAAPNGEEGLKLASDHAPMAVILDLRLPGMDGWSVLAALKEDTRTRHIPVHIVSVEEASTEALRKGAIGHATKPLDLKDLEETFRRLEQASSGKPRRVLVVEDEERIRRETVMLIGDGDVVVDEAASGEEAMQALRSVTYDCVVLDLGLPDLAGGDLIARLDREGVTLPPLIIYTSREITRQEEMDLREHADSIVIKDVRSQERLLDEVSLFLHRVVSEMPEKKKRMILSLHETDALLKDKKALIVDDDMRTAFALSHLLSERGMKTFKAENGERALRILDQEPSMNLVLMDIMMPVMDGYETIKRIRAQARFQQLPIIVLTAKAMPEDRTKCLAAGANDYLSKPLDEARLVSMMRVWLYK